MAGKRPEALRAETSGNDGNPSMRQQIIGNINAEVLDSEPQLEGRDDIKNRTAAPRESTSNGVRRMNVHASSGFNANSNDPSTRFHSIVRGYECMNNLSNAIVRSFDAPFPTQARTMRDIRIDYEQTWQCITNATTERETAFYNRVLNRLEQEMDALEA